MSIRAVQSARFTSSAIFLVLSIHATQATAQTVTSRIGGQAVLTVACANNTSAISPARLIAALYSQTGRFRDEGGTVEEQAALVADGLADARVLVALRNVDTYLRSTRDDDEPIAAFSGPLTGDSDALRRWLQAGARDATLRCAPEEDEENATPFPLVFRGSVDALSATGDDVRTTDAARIAITRTLETQDDGSERRTTDFTVDAVLGLRLTPAGSTDSAFAFIGYERDRTEISPRDADNDEDPDTLEVLTIGVRAHALLGQGDVPDSETAIAHWVAGDIAYVEDRVAGSQVLRLNALWRPGFGDWAPMRPFCRFGSFTRTGAVRSRCTLEMSGTAAHVLRRGDGEFAFADSYFAAGPIFTFELMQAPDPRIIGTVEEDGGIFMRVAQRYQLVAGRGLDDIHRVDATFGYRVFVLSGLGVEMSATLAYGTNADTFERDRRFVIGAGIIF